MADLETDVDALEFFFAELHDGEVSLSRLADNTDNSGPSRTNNLLSNHVSLQGNTITHGLAADNDQEYLCVACGRATWRPYTACTKVPLLSEHSFKHSYYCSEPCQKAHWKYHKADCESIWIPVERQSLARAAQFLQRAIYIFRAASFDLSVKCVHFHGNILTIHEGEYSGPELLPSFPHARMKLERPEVSNILLSVLGCADMVVIIPRVFALLLCGLAPFCLEEGVVLISSRDETRREAGGHVFASSPWTCPLASP